MKTTHFFLILILCFLFPHITFAGVRISEIMFDPPATDTGHEWIEIENNSDSAVDITGWKLLEANSNHTLTSISGGASIPAHGFAIVADNATIFQSDNSQFTGILFDSVFSLSNTGETLVLKDAQGIVVDEAVYTGDIGANGDGNTLQKTESTWIAALATPGSRLAQNTANPDPTPTSEGDENTPDNTTTNVPTGGSTSDKSVSEKAKPAKKITVEIVLPTTAILADDAILLTAKVTGSDGNPAIRGSIFWNFGDGESVTSQGLEAVRHIYAFPGKYVVQVSYTEFYFDREPKAVDRKTITVAAPMIDFADDGLFLSIKNNSKAEITISDWKISDGEHSFVFPKDTAFLPGGLIILEKKKIHLKSEAQYQLFFPSGNTVASTNDEKKLAAVPVEETIVTTERKHTAEAAPSNETASTEEIMELPTFTIDMYAATNTQLSGDIFTSNIPGPLGEEMMSVASSAAAGGEKITKRNVIVLAMIVLVAGFFGIIFNRYGSNKNETSDGLVDGE